MSLVAPELIFARDNSSYREQKPSTRPLYPTLQAHHSNSNPCSPFPRRGLITPWITMADLPASLRLQTRPVMRTARWPSGSLPASRPLHGSRDRNLRRRFRAAGRARESI